MSPAELKLLLVIDSLVPAGAERSLVQTAPLLRDRGMAIDVVTIHDRPGLENELRAGGITVTALGGHSRRSWVRELSGLIGRSQPDLVHTTLFEAGLAGRLAARRRHVPAVSTIASEPYGAAHLENPKLNKWKIRAAQVSEAATLRLATRVHAVSEPVADAVAERLRYPRHRIDVVPRGRDPVWLGRRTAERSSAARRSLGITPDRVVALTVARHEHIKGLDTLLDAARLILEVNPETVFLLAGRRTHFSDELEDRARRLGVIEQVRFLGERDDIPELLAAADVFLLPTRREGFPGSIVEAMAMEVPIVATGIPEVRAVVDESTAVLVQPGDPQALAAGCREAIAGAGTPQRVARARREFTEHLTLEPVADAMVDFYRRATAGSG